MLQAGEIFGGTYRLEKRLGKGGMGEVWLARHTLLDEPRAIKIVLGDATENAHLRERFVRGEARNSLKLERHPNIVRVYELGQHEGIPYMVMEFVDGPTLRDILNARKMLTPQETAIYLEQLAQGLDVAHRQNMIHRDIKPGNVLVDQKNGNIAKLTDFGLIKDIATSTEDSLTGTGQYMGTPAYIAPEQAHGQADARSDIYSLGAMTYEMLAGRPPFVGISTSVLVQHVTSAPPMLRQFNPAIPEAVQQVVLRALAKNPDERYQSALEFARAYRQALQVSEYNQALDTAPLGGPMPPVPGPVTRPSPIQNPTPTPNPTPSGVTPPLTPPPSGGYNTPPPEFPTVAQFNPTPTPNPVPPKTAAAAKAFPLVPAIIIGAIALVAIVALVIILVVSGSSGGGGNQTAARTAPAITPTFTLPAQSNQAVILGGVSRNGVSVMAVSPDGKLAATGYEDSSLIIWNIETGQKAVTLTGHSGTITGVDFSPDGKQLVSCSGDNTPRLWNAADGKLLKTLEVQTAGFRNCRFIENGAQIYGIAENNARYIWKVASAEPPASLPQKESRNWLAAFSRDRKIVASVEQDNSILLLEPLTNSEIGRIPTFGEESVYAMAFTTGNERLAIALSDNTVRLWNLPGRSGMPSQQIKLDVPGSNSITAMQFSADGKKLMGGSYNGYVGLLDVDSGIFSPAVPVHERLVSGVAFLPGEERAVTVSWDNTIAINQLNPIKNEKRLGSISSEARALAVSPDGKLLAYALNRRIIVSELATNTTKYTLEGHEFPVFKLLFSPDGKRLVSLGSYEKFVIWDIETGKKVTEVTPRFSGFSAAITPDGKTLAVGAYRSVYLYETATGKPGKELNISGGDEPNFFSLVFLDNQRLLGGTTDKNIYQWDISSEAAPATPFKAQDNYINILALSPDGKWLAALVYNKVVIFDVNGKSEKTVLDLKGNGAYDLKFDSKSARLAAALGSGEIYIWQTAGGKFDQQPQILRGHNDSVTNFAFVLDENYGVSSSEDGTIRLWKI
jgi:WD40 repeat protein/serine/threonine protein kinase